MLYSKVGAYSVCATRREGRRVVRRFGWRQVRVPAGTGEQWQVREWWENRYGSRTRREGKGTGPEGVCVVGGKAGVCGVRGCQVENDKESVNNRKRCTCRHI